MQLSLISLVHKVWFGYVVLHNVHIMGESTIKYTFRDQEKCKVAIN